MKKTCAAFLGSCLLLLLAACSVEGLGRGGTGTLTLLLSETTSRSLAPNLDMRPASYRISGSHEGGASFLRSLDASATRLDLDRLVFGEWEILVRAYNGDSPLPTLIGEGRARARVVTNQTSSVRITVEALPGEGALELVLDWAGSLLEDVAVEAYLASPSGTRPLEFTLDGSQASYDNPALPAGYYRLHLTVEDSGTLVAGAVETLRIVADQTTRGRVSLPNLMGPGGRLSVSVEVNMRNPIDLLLQRDAATASTSEMLNFLAVPAEASSSILYGWYVNGAEPPEGSLVSGNRLSLPEDLAPGYYRVDAIATAAGQGGNGSYVLLWAGESAAPPAAPQANWAYFDTVMGLPYVYAGAGWQKFSPNLLTVRLGPGTPAGDYSALQAAVDAAPTGSLLKLAAGSYDGTLDVTKSLSIIGAGSGDAGGTLLTRSSVSNPAPDPAEIHGITYWYNPVVVISASGSADSPLRLMHLKIAPRQDLLGAAMQVPAILFRPGPLASNYVASYSNILLDDVRVMGSGSDGTPESGPRVDGSTSLYHFTALNCEFSNMGYGMIFHNAANPTSKAMPSRVEGLRISNCIFSGNSIKGFYAEKLADARLENSSFVDNGDVERSPAWADWCNAGIDINLYSGAYSGLRFENLVVERNGLGSFGGAGLCLKARGSGDDAANAGYAATLSEVAILGGSYGGNAVGIRIGEIKSTEPFVSLNLAAPTDLRIQGASVSGNVRADLVDASSGVAGLSGQVTSY